MKKREKRKLEKSCESYRISSGTTEKGEISMGTKAKKKNDFLDKKITQALAPYPDPMCRSEFREACHIGTRTALYLLHCGLIPFVRSGKKTQPYQIAKADVAAYLRRRESEPEYYTPPSGWYKNFPQHKVSPAPVVRRLDYKTVNQKAVQHYFEEQLAPYPDLLTVVQIAEITGYSRNIVSQWCRTGRLKTFTHQPKIYIPKPWVLDFLLSEDYNSLVRKSQKHCAAIREILWQERQRDSPAGKA